MSDSSPISNHPGDVEAPVGTPPQGIQHVPNLERAKTAGWDEKMCELDLPVALEAANMALMQADETQRHQLAAEIYTSRKEQVALMIDAQLMLPSHSGAKRLHQTMLEWQSLLQGIPFLTANLINNEIEVCGNICARSKMGIMPADRAVYTAYMTFNGKEPYDQTFRKNLSSRLQEDAKNQERALVEMMRCIKDGGAHLEQLATTAQAPDATTAIKAQLQADATALHDIIETVEGFDGSTVISHQIDMLEEEISGLKPFKLVRKSQLSGRRDELQAQLDSISQQTEALVAPARAQLKAIESALGE